MCRDMSQFGPLSLSVFPKKGLNSNGFRRKERAPEAASHPCPKTHVSASPRRWRRGVKSQLRIWAADPGRKHRPPSVTFRDLKTGKQITRS